MIAINDNACDVSHSCGPGRAMATWIARDMAANQKPCTTAMWHHPLWSLGEAHKGGYGGLVPVWHQLHDLDVDVVITGHDHNYVRTVPLGKTTVDLTDSSKVSPPTLDPNGMVEFVIGTRGRRRRTKAPGGLTRREVEVLRLAARGLTTQAIADELVISPKTVDHHVQHIYTKIGVSTRAAAALWAMQNSVLPTASA